MVRKLNFILVLTLIVAIGVVSLLGFFGQYLDVAELVSHFRFLYFLATIFLVVPVIFVRNRVIEISWAFLLLLTTLPMVPLLLVVDHSLIPPNIERIKIMQANLWGGKNSNKAAVLDNVHKFDPDILVFSEITGKWETYFGTELSAYKFRQVEPRFGGIAVYSKLPLTATKVIYYGDVHRPRIETFVELNKQKFLLVAAHTFIPKYMAIRNGELEEIAKTTAASKVPVVLAGDLNCSPWSYYFAKLERDGDLVDTEPGFGLQCSWPTSVLQCIPTATFIPIDHFLISQEFEVLRRAIGTKDGSDHLPVFVELALKRSAGFSRQGPPVY
ncbi:MAG: endonuclease/exonuclease/phosphatase family protein [Cyanobacteria bacterium SZAS-4]|nr:endonuclease/exonuclease/phosphatase family protein [Cyanobacteria bacterium SZAS-4]